MTSAANRAANARRLRQARARLALSQDEMGRMLGVTREWIGKLEREGADFSDFILWKLEAAEKSEKGEPSSLLNEGPGSYGKSGIQEPSGTENLRARSASMLDPRFQPGEEPTPKACVDYFAEYLRRAIANPGGIGYVWVKLQKQFPLEEWEEKEK